MPRTGHQVTWSCAEHVTRALSARWHVTWKGTSRWWAGAERNHGPTPVPCILSTTGDRTPGTTRRHSQSQTTLSTIGLLPALRCRNRDWCFDIVSNAPVKNRRSLKNAWEKEDWTLDHRNPFFSAESDANRNFGMRVKKRVKQRKRKATESSSSLHCRLREATARKMFVSTDRRTVSHTTYNLPGYLCPHCLNRIPRWHSKTECVCLQFLHH